MRYDSIIAETLLRIIVITVAKQREKERVYKYSLVTLQSTGIVAND